MSLLEDMLHEIQALRVLLYVLVLTSPLSALSVAPSEVQVYCCILCMYMFCAHTVWV